MENILLFSEYRIINSIEIQKLLKTKLPKYKYCDILQVLIYEYREYLSICGASLDTMEEVVAYADCVNVRSHDGKKYYYNENCSLFIIANINNILDILVANN